MAGDTPVRASRRDLLKITAGVVATAGAAATRAARAAEPHKFFTADEFEMVDELSEILIPSDALSGGAKAARVAEYIDRQLGETFEDEPRVQWRAGLKLIDQAADRIAGSSFVKAAPEKRVAVVEALLANEKQPKTPEEIFFKEVKNFTIQGFYTSRIGIHDALDYKGNVLQTKDYAGELPAHPALSKPSTP